MLKYIKKEIIIMKQTCCLICIFSIISCGDWYSWNAADENKEIDSFLNAIVKSTDPYKYDLSVYMKEKGEYVILATDFLE